MKKSHLTKRLLIASAVSLFLCVAMLVGTTYAWFSDSVTSNGNTIASGTLNIDLYVKGGNTGYTDYTSIKGSNDPLFNYNLWEPGYTLWTNLKITSTGNLSFDYALTFSSINNIANDKLAEAIDVYFAEEEIAEARDIPNTLDNVGTLKQVFASAASLVSGTVIPGDPDNDGFTAVKYATIVLKMKEDAGNEYQGLSIHDFDIRVLAVQHTYESDSIDDQYDASADGSPDNVINVLSANVAETVVNGEDTVLESGNVRATVPYDADDDDTLTLTVTPTAANGNIAIESTQGIATYEVEVTGRDANSDVVALEFNIGTGLTGVVIYHNNAALAEDTANAGTDQTYYYDANTGIVYVYTSTFSPFSIVYDKVIGTHTVASVAEFNAAATDEGIDTIVLSEDMDIASRIALTRGLTLEGNGKVITVGTADDRVMDLNDTTGDVVLNLNDVTLDGSHVTKGYARGISFYGNEHVTFNAVKTTVTSPYYAINIAGMNDLFELNLANSSFAGGWAGINAWSKSVINVTDSTISGANNASYNSDGWNNFGTIVINKDDGASSAAGTVMNFTNSTISASTANGNVQVLLDIRNVNVTAAFTDCTFTYDGEVNGFNEVFIKIANGTSLTFNNCKFIYQGEEVEFEDIFKLGAYGPNFDISTCHIFVDGVDLLAD